MLAIFARDWKTVPVTAAVVWLATLLFAATRLWTLYGYDTHMESLRTFGAALSLEERRSSNVKPPNGMEPLPPVSGQFELWDGQLWRIPLSVLHHATWWHFLSNTVSMLILGRLLEPRIGHLRMVLLVLGSLAFSAIPSFLLTSGGIGISGILCAMFGLMLVLREDDPVLKQLLTPGILLFSFAWLFGAVLLTQSGVIMIDNIAHACGLLYGLLDGAVFVILGRTRHASAARTAFGMIHLAIPVGLYFVMHPAWDGSYHWYRALHATDTEVQRRHLITATRTAPSLQPPWLYLTDLYNSEGNRSAAWQTIIDSISANRSDNDWLALTARQQWWGLQSEDEVRAAIRYLSQTFGSEFVIWHDRLQLEYRPATSVAGSADRLDPAIGVPNPAEPVFPRRPTNNSATPLEPKSLDDESIDASEGVTL